MKAEALALVASIDDGATRLNRLREYVQAMVLRSLHESEAFHCLAFVGGTALRFLHRLSRFSEDLDFSLHEAAGYEPVKWMEKLKRDFSFADFDVAVKWRDRAAVNSAWIGVGGVLHEAGLAAMPDQKLSIKLEIDTRPPPGAVTEGSIVDRYMMFAIRHYDLPSLMSGKLHAITTRGYTKGRDWYDFVWYRAQRPQIEPNLALLQNALDQTEGKGKCDASDWKSLVADRIDRLDIDAVVDDVRPFLEHAQEAALLTRDGFRSLL